MGNKQTQFNQKLFNESQNQFTDNKKLETQANSVKTKNGAVKNSCKLNLILLNGHHEIIKAWTYLLESWFNWFIGFNWFIWVSLLAGPPGYPPVFCVSLRCFWCRRRRSLPRSSHQTPSISVNITQPISLQYRVSVCTEQNINNAFFWLIKCSYEWVFCVSKCALIKLKLKQKTKKTSCIHWKLLPFSRLFSDQYLGKFSLWWLKPLHDRILRILCTDALNTLGTLHEK